MQAIKFSHVYSKMPRQPDPSLLLEVFVTDRDDLSDGFVEYDTRIHGGGEYPLPNGELLVLVLMTYDGILWTTVRRSTPDKKSYYRGLRGQHVNILMHPTNHSMSDYI